LLYFYSMTSATAPDYKLLYEQSQQRLTEAESKILTAEKQTASLAEQLHLALLEINGLRRKIFGIKSDNRVTKAREDQLELFSLGATAQEIADSEEALRKEVGQLNEKQEKAAEQRRRAPRTASRMVLPEHLEREEVIIDPAGDLDDYQLIGEEVTEVLVMVPTTFKVQRIIRRKWALRNNNNQDTEQKGVLIAPIPSRTVKRGLFDESVLAHLLISKYVDHLPLYRQKKIFEREGIKIPASTLTDNTAAACQSLKPIYNSLRREVLANLYLQADETGIKVLQSEKKGACHLGYYWCYHAPVDGLVLFDYQPGRGQEGPKKLLKDFTGVLQSDGYAVYQSLFKNSEKVTQLFCMSHIRRKFDEAVSYDQKRATYAVEQIARLYKIEKDIRASAEASPTLTENQIVEIRREQASPILDEIKQWMLEEYPKVTPGSPIGKALSYALSLWDNMFYYTLHGHLHIDNNAIENAIRPIALGRKNYLFAGTHQTAQNAAMIYSLFATCKKHEINPQTWLLDVLRKLNDPDYEGKFSDLLPHRWKENTA
jgi:transposase